MGKSNRIVGATARLAESRLSHTHMHRISQMLPTMQNKPQVALLSIYTPLLSGSQLLVSFHRTLEWRWRWDLQR